MVRCLWLKALSSDQCMILKGFITLLPSFVLDFHFAFGIISLASVNLCLLQLLIPFLLFRRSLFLFVVLFASAWISFHFLDFIVRSIGRTFLLFDFFRLFLNSLQFLLDYKLSLESSQVYIIHQILIQHILVFSFLLEKSSLDGVYVIFILVEHLLSIFFYFSFSFSLFIW